MSIATRALGIPLEVHLARLACMPADAEAALGRFKAQVSSVWSALGPGRAPALVCGALVRATPPLPALRQTEPASLDELLEELDRSFWNHHPEEICVASFALLSNVADLVQAELGEAELQALLAALERHPS